MIKEKSKYLYFNLAIFSLGSLILWGLGFFFEDVSFVWIGITLMLISFLHFKISSPYFSYFLTLLGLIIFFIGSLTLSFLQIIGSILLLLSFFYFLVFPDLEKPKCSEFGRELDD